MTGIRAAIIAGLTACSPTGGTHPDAATDAWPPENPGFVRPTETTTANERVDGVWTEIGPADWSCLGAPSNDRPTTVTIELSGTTRDRQTLDIVDNTRITAFRSGDPDLVPVAETTSDADGAYSLTIPVDEARLSFLSRDPEQSRFFDTYLVHQILDPDEPAQLMDLASVSLLSLGCTFPLPDGFDCPYLPPVAAAEIRDCGDHQVAHAIATVSETSETPTQREGVVTHYFSAGSTSLHVRHSQQGDTNKDGLFIMFGLPTAPQGFMQVWGFLPEQDPATDPLTLLSEIPVSVADEAVIWTILEPRRAP